MAKAATGSFDAVVRTTASRAAVEGVAGRPVQHRPPLRRSRRAPCAVQVSRARRRGSPPRARGHDPTAAHRRWSPASPGARARCGGTARHRRPTRLRRGCRLPSGGRKGGSASDARQSSASTSCIGACAWRTLSAPRRASTGQLGGPAAVTIWVCSPWCGSWWVGSSGWGAAHGGTAVQRAWPVFLRVQILATRPRCRWWPPGG